MGFWSFHVFVQSHEPLEGRFPRKLQHTPVSHTPLFDYERYPGFLLPVGKGCLILFGCVPKVCWNNLTRSWPCSWHIHRFSCCPRRPVSSWRTTFVRQCGQIMRPYVSLYGWPWAGLWRRAHSRGTPPNSVAPTPMSHGPAKQCLATRLFSPWRLLTKASVACCVPVEHPPPKPTPKPHAEYMEGVDGCHGVLLNPSCCGDEFGHQGPRSLLWLERAGREQRQTLAPYVVKPTWGFLPLARKSGVVSPYVNNW